MVLAEHAKLQAADLISATQSRRLASGAKWSRQVAAELAKFTQALHEIVDPREASEASALPRPTRRNIAKFFGELGLAPSNS